MDKMDEKSKTSSPLVPRESRVSRESEASTPMDISEEENECAEATLYLVRRRWQRISSPDPHAP